MAIGEEFNTAPLNSGKLRYEIPAWATEEGKAKIRAYYEALGKFVHTFAETETTVTYALRAYAQTSAEIAKVIFSGAKIEVGSQYIKQLAPVVGASSAARGDLANVFQQLGIINKTRNHILHYGAEQIAEGNAFVSDEIKAKGDPVVFPVSPELLEDMISDLRKIMVHLNYNHLGRPWPKGELGLDLVKKTMDAPWRYKQQTL